MMPVYGSDLAAFFAVVWLFYPAIPNRYIKQHSRSFLFVIRSFRFSLLIMQTYNIWMLYSSSTHIFPICFSRVLFIAFCIYTATSFISSSIVWRIGRFSSSLRFAETTAAAIEGQTAFPQRATCALFGYGFSA